VFKRWYISEQESRKSYFLYSEGGPEVELYVATKPVNFLHSVSGYPFVTGAVIYPGRWTVAKLKVSVAIDLYEKYAVQILADLLTIMTGAILSCYSSVSPNRSRLPSKFLHTVQDHFTLYNLCS
jgi:hypothetical protein